MTDWGNLFDGSTPIKLPFDLPGLMAIPGKRGVFLLEGPNQAPLLLATAADIRSRLRFKLSAPEEGTASRKADLREIAVRLHWKLATSHFENDWHFLELSRAIYPDSYTKLLAFSPVWFAHVDLTEKAPAFRPTRDLSDGPGEFFGPLAGKSAAQKYIDALLEVFDLCRHEGILRQAPNGRPCMYAQMGRCRCPCNGSISMDEYRGLVVQAVDLAAGGRESFRQGLLSQMKQLAAGQQYEQASACKARLARLAELDKPEFANVTTARQLRYLLVQDGPGLRKLRTFYVDRGTLAAGPEMEFKKAKGQSPTIPTEQLQAVLLGMADFCGQVHPIGQPQRECLALVAHYLQGNPDKAGLILRWSEDLKAERLAGEIEKTFPEKSSAGGAEKEE